MAKIKLYKNFYEGKDVGYSQFFGGNKEAYAKFGLQGHNGVDVPIPTGTKLYSAIDGKVLEAQNDPTGYGNYVKIENSECGVLYGHLKSFNVKVGDTLKHGDLVGVSNNTGNSTGPHLHFGVYPIPRNRNNGFAGYIDPFDKNLVEWVDSIEPEVVEPKPVEYPAWKSSLWRFARVFLSAFVVTLASGLTGTTDINVFKALLIASTTAGISALGKYLRENSKEKEEFLKLFF